MSQPEGVKPASVPSRASADAQLFREVIRHLASGVMIITSSFQGKPVGLTATAVCSISVAPPTLLISLGAASHTATGVAETGAFAVHLLPHKARKYAEQFASSGEHFVGVEYSSAPESNVPLLRDVLGWFLCEVQQAIPVTDHIIYLGRVIQCELKDKRPDPLLYFDRGYRKLAPGAEPGAERFEPWGAAEDAGLPGFGWS
jgi:flavin reductase (DIM6/NTAB) family NADH-FMN oxidoreductase RutF